MVQLYLSDINFLLGLIPVLRKVLLSAHEQGLTRRAVLCAEGICHIRSSRGFDNGKYTRIFDVLSGIPLSFSYVVCHLGWGCGYRNLEMALTALLVFAPHYRPVFPSVHEPGCSHSPGVRNLQIWMEAAWKDGKHLCWEEVGSQDLKKTCGSRV